MNKKISLIPAIILFSSYCLLSSITTQNQEFTAADIKTVWFEKEGLKLVYPVISLPLNEEITIHFDLLSSNSETLYYKFIHCDSEWNTSDLFYNDYQEGFEENPLSNYEASFNTKVTYSHYSLSFPNDDIRFTISGNYLLQIYRYDEAESPLLCRRVLVHEGSAPLSASFRRSMASSYETGQQAEISISINTLGVTDPYRQVTLTILQNGRWDRAKTNMKPDFVGNGTVEYNTLSGSTLFDGGNEFRFFDIKNIRQKMQNVRAIDFIDNRYHVFLLPSENREYKQYFNNEDLNGKYYIALDGDNDPDRDADYVYVYFSLPASQELIKGSLYISGALTNWSYTTDNKMIYNQLKGIYEGSLLLKQGWYNYEYAFIPDSKKSPEGNAFEGSHFETENDYLMLVYFNDPTKRYDRLVNAVIVNTRNH
jgi:hypothetical protein